MLESRCTVGVCILTDVSMTSLLHRFPCGATFYDLARMQLAKTDIPGGARSTPAAPVHFAAHLFKSVLLLYIKGAQC